MKLQLVLLAVLPIAFAADCVCPQVKCPGDEPAVRSPLFSTVPIVNLSHGLTLRSCVNASIQPQLPATRNAVVPPQS